MSISYWNDYTNCVAILPWQEEEIDFKYLQQWGVVPGLDWKGVEHWHADGTLLLDVTVPGVSRVFDALRSIPTTPKTTSVSGGVYGIGNSSYFYIPVGSRATAVLAKNVKEWRVTIAEVREVTKGKYLMARAMILVAREYDSTRKRNVYNWKWSAIKGFVRSGATWASDTFEGAIGNLEWNETDCVRVTLNKAYTNSARPVNIPTRAQITSLLSHELSLVVGLALRTKYEALEKLHAAAFDSVMKFDGNLLLFFSKFGSFGRTTIQSMLDWAGSGMGLKDAASLWLSARYGDRLAASGLRDLVASIHDELLSFPIHTTRFVEGSSMQSLSVFDEDTGVTANGYLSTRVALKPKDYNTAMRLIRSAYEWDWFPSLGNTWDAIPLSFVVDWFVNVGDIYASIDRMVAARYYDVVAVLNTVKVIAHTTRCPEVEFYYYDREISNSLQLSVASVEFGLPSPVNCVSGASLLVGFT
jgi:hypothetical protein